MLNKPCGLRPGLFATTSSSPRQTPESRAEYTPNTREEQQQSPRAHIVINASEQHAKSPDTYPKRLQITRLKQQQITL